MAFRGCRISPRCWFLLSRPPGSFHSDLKPDLAALQFVHGILFQTSRCCRIHTRILRIRRRSKPIQNCAFPRQSDIRSCTATVCSDGRGVSRRCQYEARIRHQSHRGPLRIGSENVASARFRALAGEAMGDLWASIVIFFFFFLPNPLHTATNARNYNIL